MAEKSKTREVIEKGAWAALAIGFIGVAIFGVSSVIKLLASNLSSLPLTKTS